MKFSIACFLMMSFSFNLAGQNIKIADTTKANSDITGLRSASSFTIEGQVIGLDSGTIKISSPDDGLLGYVPLKQGRFFFSGFVKSTEQVHFLIEGDYYDNVFYLEPGKIKIKYNYQHKATASGTRENDLSNYFRDTLNKKNSERFGDLSNKVNIALKEENLSLYLKLIDSFTIVEKDFFETLNKAIAQKRFGDYLLSYINYYYINYGYFSERKAIFDRLPENIKNTVSGKRSLEFLEQTRIKNTGYINQPAYQFTLKDINNKIIALKEFKGEIIVLDFWASWCLPCIKALPLLKKIQAHDISKNVVYISISIDKKEKEWREKEKIIHIPWLSLLADESAIKNYEANTVPDYIVINKEGKIASKSSSLSDLYITLKRLQK